MIYGQGNKRNLILLYKTVAKGFPWPLGAFENQHTFLSVENISSVKEELLANEAIPSGVYNVPDDATTSTNDLIDLIASSQKRKVRLLKISPRLITVVVLIGKF